MFPGTQFSSLPLLPTMRAYTMETVVLGIRCKGQLSLWAEGSYFQGFFVVTEIPGFPAPPDVVLVSGQVHQSMLRLQFFAPESPAGNDDTIGYTTSNATFSFDMNKVEDTYIVGVIDKGDIAKGTFTLVRIN
jgi:hypothetical protein